MRLTDLGDPRRGDVGVPLASPEARIALGGPTLAIGGVRRGDLGPDRLALAVVSALVAGGTEVAVYVLSRGEGEPSSLSEARGRPFLDAGAGVFRGARVPADVVAVDAQLRAHRDADGACARVAIGTDFLARAHVDYGVLVTGGAPLGAWSPAARAVHERVGLMLVEPRSGVARGLAARLLGG